MIGSTVVFAGAYLVEKGRGLAWLRGLVHLMAMVPLAVPGLVLGISYIFFFNHPANPLNGLIGTMAILVLCTVVHFYTVSHLTAVTALKQIDPEFEAVSASLKVPFYKTFWRVTVPVCLPTILDIALYLFVNAMTTVSAVVFLFSADTKLAADLGARHGRRRIDGGGGGDGDDDRLHVGRRCAACTRCVQPVAAARGPRPGASAEAIGNDDSTGTPGC